MNIKRLVRFSVIAVLFVSVLLWLSSCRSAREIPMKNLKPLSTGKLLKKVEQNALDFEYLTIRRINCQYSDGQTKTTFKVNLKAARDDKILVSISKLNFPVGRVLLTPDSVRYVNYLEKNFFLDDYSYLSRILNIDLDFETVQSILANNAFSYRNDPKEKDFRTFDSSAESGMYVLQSEKERKIEKMEEERNRKKVERRLTRLGDEALIIQKMFINPQTFALTKLIISDKSNNRHMEIDFDEFEKVNRKDYPGSIDMIFSSPRNTVSLKTKMSGFTTDKIESFNFKIPEKYDQIHLN